jgi:hypothetical protein
MAFPAFFHVALIFFPRCRFVNPDKMGEVLAIWRAFKNVGFSRLAWAVHLGCLEREDRSIYQWKSEEQVYPMCRELKNYFRSKSYRRSIREAMARHTYIIDWPKFEPKFEEEISSLERDSRPPESG